MKEFQVSVKTNGAFSREVLNMFAPPLSFGRAQHLTDCPWKEMWLLFLIVAITPKQNLAT